MRRFYVGLIITTFLVFAPFGFAEAVLYIDDTSTVEKGHWEVDFSVDYYKDIEKEFDPDTEEYTKAISKELDLTAGITYGLLDNWDIGVSVPYVFLDDSQNGEVDGFSDIFLYTKYRLWQEKKILPSYAFYFDLKADSANEDKGLGTGKKDYSINNILTKTIGDNIFDLNLGYTFVGGKADDVFFYSFDIWRDLTEKLGIGTEIYGETTFAGNFDDNIFCWALSLGYEINEMIYFECGAGGGISKSSPDLQISTTLTFCF